MKRYKRTHEITILVVSHTCLLHSLVEHFSLWFADKSVRAIVAVGYALEEIVEFQQLDYSLAVRDVGVCEQP